MSMKQVKVRTEVYLDEIDGSKGYVMQGFKGDFIAARDTQGKYSFVRLTPGKVTTPVTSFDTLQELIASKLEKGYEVFEFEKAELS